MQNYTFITRGIFRITLRSVGKLDVNSAIIIGSRAIDYAARKYAFVNE